MGIVMGRLSSRWGLVPATGVGRRDNDRTLSKLVLRVGQSSRGRVKTHCNIKPRGN